MKKIVLLLSIFATLGALTTGCLEERIIIIDPDIPDNPPPDPPDPPDPPTTPKTIKVNATVEQSPFALDLSNSIIGLFVYQDDNGLVDNRQTQLAGGYSEFEYEGSDSLGFVFGYYYPPQSPAHSMLYTLFNGYLDSIQNQSVTTNASASAIPQELTRQMLLVSTKSNIFGFTGGSGTIQLRNVFSLLQFKITKDPALQNFVDQKIKSFQVYPSWGMDFESPSPYADPIAGDYSIDVLKASDHSAELKPNFSVPSRRIKGTIQGTSPAISSNANEALVIWTLVAPFDVFGVNKLVIRLETENSDGSIHYTTLNMFDYGNIPRNTITSFNVVLTKDSVYSDDLVNESLVNSPANTYVISEAGIFAISTKTPTGVEKAVTNANATWLWASKAGGGNSFDINDLIGNIEYNATKERIQFRVGTENGVFNEGNVILALRDASNNILWSWHLWLTDPPQDLAYEGGVLFMDRNLGALTASKDSMTDAFGFLYQWGRKDPFYSGNGSLTDEGNSVFSLANSNTKTNNVIWNVKSSQGSDMDALRNPTQFISVVNNTSNDQPVDWRVSSDNNLWSATGSKTDNDPCPDGYRVPSRDDFTALRLAYGQYINNNNNSNYYFKRLDSIYWEYRYPNVTNIWPAAGRRQGVAISDEGTGGQLKFAGTNSVQGQLYYWTSTTIDPAVWQTAAGAYRINTQGPSVLNSEDEWGNKADAYSVRCVKK